MDTWQDLVAAALVGTGRQDLPRPPAGTPLGHLLARLEGADKEAALLGSAAAVCLYQRAGRLPGTVEAGPAPAEVDTLPVCGAASAANLEIVMRSRRPLLPEWLAAAALQEKRVPEGFLPDLLDIGRQSRELREPLSHALGRRGDWLAARNPDWSYYAGETEDDSAWETGVRAARAAYLRGLRERDPAAGGELLTAAWEAEGPEERAAFITALESGLSMADEPFLEAALDDRRKEVRATAGDLLRRLPESRLVRRMIDRVQPLVTIRKGLLRRGLEVTLPDACDKAMLRDGIEPKPSMHRKGLGEKAWWLLQLVGSVPPRHWQEDSGPAPAEIVALGQKNEWRIALLDGWSAAAERHRHPEWAEALLMIALTQPVGREREVYGFQAGLVEALPPARREAFTLQLLREHKEPLSGQHPLMTLVAACRHPWSEPFAREVLDSVRRRANEPKPKWDYYLTEALKSFALYVPPSMAEEAAAGWPREKEQWQYYGHAVDDFLTTLQFRHDMLHDMLEETAR